MGLEFRYLSLSAAVPPHQAVHLCQRSVIWSAGTPLVFPTLTLRDQSHYHATKTQPSYTEARCATGNIPVDENTTPNRLADVAPHFMAIIDQNQQIDARGAPSQITQEAVWRAVAAARAFRHALEHRLASRILHDIIRSISQIPPVRIGALQS